MGLEVITVARLVELQRAGTLPAAPVAVTVANGQESAVAHLAHMTTALPAHASLAGNTFRPDAAVHTIEKTSRNPFGDMVTVGRAANNDIILTDTGVSKFHAYFRPVGGTMRVHDAGSTNGTKVDGRVVGREGTPISTLTRIELGPSTTLIYVAKDDLADWIDSVASSLGAIVPGNNAARVPTPDSGAATHRLGTLERGTATTRREPVGSLAAEPLGDLLRRLERDGFTGTIDVEANGGRLELVCSLPGMLTAFRAAGRPGVKGDLLRGLETRSGIFRLKGELPAEASGVGSPLGRISDVLASL